MGRNFEALDPLEWLAGMSDHIPDPGQHRTLFYGEYAHLGLSPPRLEKSPPIREVLRVAEHGEGWGVPPEWG